MRANDKYFGMYLLGGMTALILGKFFWGVALGLAIGMSLWYHLRK